MRFVVETIKDSPPLIKGMRRRPLRRMVGPFDDFDAAYGYMLDAARYDAKTILIHRMFDADDSEFVPHTGPVGALQKRAAAG
jgi:hypothetical protein